MRALWTYAVCWPQLWHKMVKRVPGAGAGGRYCGGELYGQDLQLPPGKTWREWTFSQLELYPTLYKRIIAGNVAALLEQHRKKTNRPLTESDPDPMTGLCWKALATMVNRGDLKGRRMASLTTQSAWSKDEFAEVLEEGRDDCRY